MTVVVEFVDVVKARDAVEGVEVMVIFVVLIVREMGTLKIGATTCMVIRLVIRTKVLMLLNPLQTLSQRLIR